ncbi:hypothetical protein ASD05_03675 [Variovorax sp. Root434]|nr:hypothetical protein ASD05_03675 [Variovorax sp. Root434]
MLRKKGMLEEMNAFYEGILGYERDAELDVLRVPGHRDLAVCFKYFNSTGKKNERDGRALYEFFIERNFPSFCQGLKEKGVEFTMLARTPASYFARVLDPSGNLIEVISESFEDDFGVDVSGWGIYQDIG